jgi:hypothetical protein
MCLLPLCALLLQCWRLTHLLTAPASMQHQSQEAGEPWWVLQHMCTLPYLVAFPFNATMMPYSCILQQDASLLLTLSTQGLSG